MQEASTECKYPDSEQTPNQPPTREQAVCMLRACNRILGILKADGTFNVEKMSQQFTDYGYEVPDDINTLENISYEEKPQLFVERAFAFFKKNKAQIRRAFYLPTPEV